MGNPNPNPNSDTAKERRSEITQCDKYADTEKIMTV